MQIGDSLVEILDSIKRGSRSTTQAFDLWEDIPHPVADLSAVCQFLQDGVDIFALCGNETFELVVVRHNYLEVGRTLNGAVDLQSTHLLVLLHTLDATLSNRWAQRLIFTQAFFLINIFDFIFNS